MKTFSFAFLPAALICLGIVSFSSDNDQRIDAVIADPAFNKVMPITELDPESFRARDIERLDYLAELLESRDVSDWSPELQAARAATIGYLRDYREQAAFPTNYDHPDRPLPCFVDRDGNHCAVAYLMARSGEEDLVREINARYKYSTISAMAMPEIDAWVARAGLTRAEAITIQVPSMEPGENGISIRGGSTILSSEILQSIELQPADTTAPPQQAVDTTSTSPAIAGT